MDLKHSRLTQISVDKSEFSSTNCIIWTMPYFGTDYHTSSQPPAAQKTILGGHAISSKSQKKVFQVFEAKTLGSPAFESLYISSTYIPVSQTTY